MPSFGRHNRNYSWPPSLHHVSQIPHIRESLAQQPSHRKQDTSNDAIPDIDEDPFSHFISPMNMDDDPDNPMSMSAGIMNTESIGFKRDRFCASLAKRWARSVTPREKDNIHYHPYSRPHSNSLALNQKLHHPHYNVEIRTPRHILTVSNTSQNIPTIVVTEYLEDPSQNRAQQLLIAAQRMRRRRRTNRTLSGHRHSWQEPSPDLYTVLEEGAHHEVAVQSASEDEMYEDSDVESLNSEDEALYAEDDDFQVGWAELRRQPSSGERARL
ncbi:hypothetical protein NA57DRAFT_51301 [Rhizodiscina lignyota]|uniref:Uncharacterized protein n=1 Tax=Rhizodiscina lignyota TaxID=1504668 RepID=A0A9P4IR02_9PEZI|nr:hypothetical protein NA57DRAFT_51301 [Rhizodiscina lignyota]